MVASTRQHRARLIKYYPKPPCAPSLVKSRTLRPLQTHFLLFQQQIFFVLVCIRPGNARVPPRVLARGNNIKFTGKSVSVRSQKTNGNGGKNLAVVQMERHVSVSIGCNEKNGASPKVLRLFRKISAGTARHFNRLNREILAKWKELMIIQSSI